MNEAREIVSPVVARRYLVEENGWTDAEAEAFTASLSEHESYRTRDEWTRLATEWAAEQNDEDDESAIPEPTEGRRALVLTIDLEGAAFQEGFADMEVSDILRKAAQRVEFGHLAGGAERLAVGASFTIQDVNGSTCTTVTVESH